MKNISNICAAACLLLFIAPLHAQDSSRDKRLSEPLFDKLIGDWKVERKLRDGRTEKNLLHAEWVLHHQFVQLHYRDVATPPTYEAIILIGYDEVGKRYICHWADYFGGSYSTDGFAPRATASSQTATPLIPNQIRGRRRPDKVEKGEWKLFCEDRFTRAAPGNVKQ